MAEVSKLLSWTFVSECPIPEDVNELLVPGETAIAAYKTFRDSAVFTNKRLIVRDAQGLTGKKVEVFSLPYHSIHMWSSENGGRFDFDAEVSIWTHPGHIKIKLRKGIDVRRFDKIIATALLNK
ncbi:PH domain-containing protein [Candidatus Saccharibacteria bacterium]|nr:PH domain-containing protein [Candidatus Saccharibacteria bacterium]